MKDCLIIGGGVLGLSLAYELSQHGLSVRVLDKNAVGQEASWAGAGILPPAGNREQMHPYDQICRLAFEQHPLWAERLREETGIDTGFRRCGGLHVARTAGEAALLRGMLSSLAEEGIEVQPLVNGELRDLEPQVAKCADITMACRLPQEHQLRNPHHLQALATACRNRGVVIDEHVEVCDWVTENNEIKQVQTTAGQAAAGSFCFTSGAWTGELLRKMGVQVGVMPIRGQIVLFQAKPGILTHIVNEGPRYLVPREDGLVLAGSTEEEVGFDKSTTAEAISDLRRFATTLVPKLAEAEVIRSWAGLRPGAYDGFPYLGQLPAISNGFVAAGHFRSGLYLSPATAIVMSQLIRGEQPQIDLAPFRVSRG